jgi:hypothetical protein
MKASKMRRSLNVMLGAVGAFGACALLWMIYPGKQRTKTDGTIEQSAATRQTPEEAPPLSVVQKCEAAAKAPSPGSQFSDRVRIPMAMFNCMLHEGYDFKAKECGELFSTRCYKDIKKHLTGAPPTEMISKCVSEGEASVTTPDIASTGSHEHRVYSYVFNCMKRQGYGPNKYKVCESLDMPFWQNPICYELNPPPR